MHDPAIATLIRNRYEAVHEAKPATDYPVYLTIGLPEAPEAALGFRNAGDGSLFLEAYLEQPVETLLAERFGRPVPRARIVELGDHASRRSTATVALWREAATALEGQADVAVAVLTRPLRVMFERLGLHLLVLAPARVEVLGEAGKDWGRYYESDPMVCAGNIATCGIELGRTGVGAKRA